MHYSLSLIVLFILVTNAVEFTAKNFDELTTGKNVFIKFFAPWCGHCKKLAPTWDRLMEEYEDDDSIVIGKMDCTVEKNFCNEQNIRGYPTLKYWNPNTEDLDQGDRYTSSRDYDRLKTFIDENLVKGCDYETEDGCNSKEIKFIKKMKAKTNNERKAEIDRLTNMLSKPMKTQLKTWVNKRLNILKQTDTVDVSSNRKEEL